ncbi:MAG: O-antigen ligase family protein, partial [Acidimicrobiia bacterium]
MVIESMLFGAEAVDVLGPSVMARGLVVIVIAACIAGAWTVARNLRKAPPERPTPGEYDAPLISDDLTTLRTAPITEPRAVRIFEVALIMSLLGYVFFDRGFAWIHIPGLPVFIGEVVLLLGAVAVFSQPSELLAALRRSPALKLLGLFMGWGFTLLVFLGIGYGLDAVRDSVLWYYGAVAVFTLFLLISDPQRIRRWMYGFSRILPWLVGWLFIAVALDSVFSSGPIIVPDSQVSFFSHGAGNSGVVAVMCLAFIWLVDRDSKFYTPTMRMGLTAACGTLLLFVSLKNRGGFVAGAIGIVLILIFLNRDRFDLTVTLVGIAAIIASVALVSQVSVALFGDREVSADQFVENVTSIINPSSGGHRQTSTTEWRLELWKNVLGDVNSEFPITGYGPGPDLGEIYNVAGSGAVKLRNPHNSHVGVIARMGWVGFGLWVLMWSVWALLLLDLRSRLAHRGRF